MTENVYWILDTSVKEGELENVKALMNEMIEQTMANEPGTTGYEWHVSEDGKNVTLYERYKDSAATLAHLDNFGKNFASRFMKMLDIKKFVVYGSPDETATKALTGIGAKIMKPLGGFHR
ncbi:MAG: antibiotic biosynthesis monooxygenase [Ignavibacteria bacterium]